MTGQHDAFDLTTMHIAEPALGMQTGRGVLLTHPREKCDGRGIPCCIHSPSDHHMRTWEMNWRGDTGVMERICPHGTGHPDPDHMAYVRSLTPDHLCIHDVLEYTLDMMILKDIPDYRLTGEAKCRYPHLEWQGIHDCDLCCTPARPRIKHAG